MVVRGFTPYEKQQDWINQIEQPEVKYITLCSGRQIGKSLLGQNLLLKWALSTPNQTIMWISPIYSQARKVFEDLERAIDDAPILKSKNKSNYDMEFVNGSKVMFRSAERYDNLRGNTLNYLIVDEAAYIDDKVWREVLKPTILVKGKKVIFLSTPKGKNWFYEMSLRGEDKDQPEYITINASSYDNPYISKEDLEESKKTLPSDIYKQEILGVFVDSGGEVFKDIDDYCVLDSWIPKTSGKYYAGVDFGRADDYSVVTIISSEGEVVDIYRERQKDWDTIVSEITNRLKSYDATAQVEVNGIGDVLYEQLRKKYSKVSPFVTTNQSKQQIIEDLIYGLNTHQLLLPSKELFYPLYGELKSFTYKYSPSTRKVIYGGVSGSHDDCVMSLAIAYNTYKSKKTSGVYAIYGN